MDHLNSEVCPVCGQIGTRDDGSLISFIKGGTLISTFKCPSCAFAYRLIATMDYKKYILNIAMDPIDFLTGEFNTRKLSKAANEPIRELEIMGYPRTLNEGDVQKINDLFPMVKVLSFGHSCRMEASLTSLIPFSQLRKVGMDRTKTSFTEEELAAFSNTTGMNIGYID